MYAVYSASVVGDSHTTAGKGNEDSVYIGRGSADWISCVVSDGCGSAKHAATGSKYIAELVGEALLRVAGKIERKGPGAWITDDIIAELAGCKNKLREIVGPELRDYHATVVAALVSPKGGFLLHIGDGIAANFELTPTAPSTVQLRQATTSEPENGEYSNETFYLTEPSWIRHFRITPITSINCVVLCTDGAQDILFDRNDANHDQFKTILSIVRDKPSVANALLKDHLLTEFSRHRSSDDKTIAIICSPEFETTLRATREFTSTPSNATPKPTTPTSPQTNKPPPLNPRPRPSPPSRIDGSVTQDHKGNSRPFGRYEYVRVRVAIAAAAAALVAGCFVGILLTLIPWSTSPASKEAATAPSEPQTEMQTVTDFKSDTEIPATENPAKPTSTNQTQRSLLPFPTPQHCFVRC